MSIHSGKPGQRLCRWLLTVATAVVFLIPAFVLSGCVTRGDINDVMLPYTVVRQIVIARLPGGLRVQSSNGRELTSHFFSPKGLDAAIDQDELIASSERAYAQVVILGSSRPYMIDVKVIREKRQKGSAHYNVLGIDKRLSEELASRIREALADRREGGNVIDDFRAF